MKGMHSQYSLNLTNLKEQKGREMVLAVHDQYQNNLPLCFEVYCASNYIVNVQTVKEKRACVVSISGGSRLTQQYVEYIHTYVLRMRS